MLELTGWDELDDKTDVMELFLGNEQLFGTKIFQKGLISWQRLQIVYFCAKFLLDERIIWE